MLKQPNVLLVEMPLQFIALCESTGVSPQAALRGMAASSAACATTPTAAWYRWRAKLRDA